MDETADDRVMVRARLMLCPALWCWEIVDVDHGAVIASSWTDEWLAYDSPAEALAAVPPLWKRRARETVLVTPRPSGLRRTA